MEAKQISNSTLSHEYTEFLIMANRNNNIQIIIIKKIFKKVQDDKNRI